MGSRYGGLKQMDTFTPEGDTIIDFSIYDALRAGFGKIVFIIRRHFAKAFKDTISDKVGGRIAVEFVYQDVADVPQTYINTERIKPWGTGHALLMAKHVVKENFAIINADDFYGREAFKIMAKVLSENDENSFSFYSMSYYLKNTISDYGAVSRGECTIDDHDFLLKVKERPNIEYVNGKLLSKEEDGRLIPISGNTVVSMNFWGFTPRCFELAEQAFVTFLEAKKDDLKAEFYIPSLVNKIINSKMAKVKVLKSGARWFGVTYKEDKAKVEKAIKTLRKQGVYPINLWSDDVA